MHKIAGANGDDSIGCIYVVYRTGEVDVRMFYDGAS